jgi:dTDP-4-amino-4,6-dideoxygalactose transaminase
MTPKVAKMRDTFLPFALPMLGEAEIEGVLECLRSGWLTTGPKTKQFEQEFAAYVGAKHALAVNSCTAALHLGLEALGVGAGDEVITTPMTFTATAAVIEHLNARPVFVDVEPQTLNLDVRKLEERITPRTKAILPVHFAGQACDMTPLLELARKRGLPVIEDAAHAIPTRYQGRLIGTFGDLTCFSFYATKNITTGEGGMITTDRDDLADRVRLMHLHGMSRDAWKRYTESGSWAYEILAPGFKYNLGDVASAIGIPQLRSCETFHARRREIARRYSEAFKGLPGVSVPVVADDASHAWHLYVIQVDGAVLSIGRDEFIREMMARKVGVSVHFIPLHIQPYYRDKYGLKPTDYPNAYAAYQRILSLPIYARMSDADVDDVIAAVRDIAESSQR